MSNQRQRRGLAFVRSFFEVERNAAFALVLAAATGLGTANLGGFPGISAIKNLDLHLLGLQFSFYDWLGEFLMTGFFLLIGLELKRELVSGAFRNRKNLITPALAAVCGAFVPAGLYLFLNRGSSSITGWPIPMATDVTFALAVFAIFGRKLPANLRLFLLSFAIIDDLVAVVVLAALNSAVSLGWAGMSLIFCFGFWAVSRETKNVRKLSNTGLVLLHLGGLVFGLLAWYCLARSGVQPAVIGVLLGILVAERRIERFESSLHPVVSMAVLPLFAFFAAAVQFSGGLSVSDPLTFGILLRPVGKVIGICLGVATANLITRGETLKTLRATDYLRVSVLGGIGFTVSLLVANSVFSGNEPFKAQATIATFVAMLASVVLGAIALGLPRRQD